jgi:hypothetical protein
LYGWLPRYSCSALAHICSVGSTYASAPARPPYPDRTPDRFNRLVVSTAARLQHSIRSFVTSSACSFFACGVQSPTLITSYSRWRNLGGAAKPSIVSRKSHERRVSISTHPWTSNQTAGVCPGLPTPNRSTIRYDSKLPPVLMQKPSFESTPCQIAVWEMRFKNAPR